MRLCKIFGPDRTKMLHVNVDPGSNSIAVLDGLGGDALANPSPLLTSTPATVVRGGDFNGDGVTDLAVLGTDGVSIYLGDGQGASAADDLRRRPRPDRPDRRRRQRRRQPRPARRQRLRRRPRAPGQRRRHLPPLSQRRRAGRPGGGQQRRQRAAHVHHLRPGSTPGRDPVRPGRDAADRGRPVQGVLSPGAVTLADLNGDGIPDLIVANSGSNNVLVYPGLGNGQFGPALDLLHRHQPRRHHRRRPQRRRHPRPGRRQQGLQRRLDPARPGPGRELDADARAAAQGRRRADVDRGQGRQRRRHPRPPGQRQPVERRPPPARRRQRLLQRREPARLPDRHQPGQVFVGNFTGQPGQLDLVTVNAGSNDLSFFPNINGDVHRQGAPSWPTARPSRARASPPAACSRSRPSRGISAAGAAATDLLVANNGDGHLALFLGGTDGLELAQTFEEPDLPNPTALAIDAARRHLRRHRGRRGRDRGGPRPGYRHGAGGSQEPAAKGRGGAHSRRFRESSRRSSCSP